MSEKAIKEAQNLQEVRGVLPDPAEIWAAAVRAVKNSAVPTSLATRAQLLANKAWKEGVSYDQLEAWMERASKDK